jgi:hypothetical protein
MLGSLVVEEAVVGGAVAVGEEVEVLEDDAPGFASPPQAASNIEATRGTATSAAEVFFTLALCPF